MRRNRSGTRASSEAVTAAGSIPASSELACSPPPFARGGTRDFQNNRGARHALLPAPPESTRTGFCLYRSIIRAKIDEVQSASGNQKVSVMTKTFSSCPLRSLGGGLQLGAIVVGLKEMADGSNENDRPSETTAAPVTDCCGKRSTEIILKSKTRPATNPRKRKSHGNQGTFGSHEQEKPIRNLSGVYREKHCQSGRQFRGSKQKNGAP